MAKYLQAAYGEGKFFEYSKEPKEGFTEHKNKEGLQKGFRKYYDNMVGTLESLTITPNPNLQGNPDELRISFKDMGGDYLILSMMLLSPSKDYSNFVDSFIQHLPSLEKDKVYEVTPYNFENENGRKLIGLTIKHDGKKLDRLTQSKIFKDGTTVTGDIPPIKWTTSKRTGRAEADTEDRFLYMQDVLKEGMAKFVYVPQATTASASTAPAPTTAKATAVTTTADDDELPF